MPLIRIGWPIRIGPSRSPVGIALSGSAHPDRPLHRTLGMKPRRALVALVVPLLACSPGASDGSTGSGDEVVIEHIAFEPANIEVDAGTTITWTNRDDRVTHTVTSGRAGDKGIPGVDEGRPNEPDGIFAGELDGAGSTFSFTFDEPGTYDYFCEIHPVMTASVLVD